MKLLIFFLLILTSSLSAITIDSSARSFEMREKKRIDTFDFSGEYPELETIDIDAKKKMRVEMKLTGNYPVLEKIIYDGGFGTLNGKLTGQFPKLETVAIHCGHCKMNLDLTGISSKSCNLTICGGDEPIHLKLPKNVGLKIHTKTSPQGKVIIEAPLKKQEWFSLWSKNFANDLVETSPIILTIDILANKAYITLSE